MSTRKRKYKSHPNHARESRQADVYRQDEPHAQDPVLFIHAYEADIVKGPSSNGMARALEVERDPTGRIAHVGQSLMKLNSSRPYEGDESEANDGREHASGDIWVDRYDARLLLDDSGVPSVRQNAPIESSGRYSPTGWSNLPSDAEDTFFFSTEETEDYRREKRRRLIEKSREDRLKAMRAEREEEEAQNEEEQWGGSDEEPDDTQRELMRRTASHLSSSPNPAQLEMRILANHGADRRFAFLKGRWSRAWKATKARIRLENEKAKEAEEKKANATSGVLGGLTGYGDSDEDSDAKSEDESTPAGAAEPSSSVPSSDITSVADDEALKAARRARANEWMERRRAEKAEGS